MAIILLSLLKKQFGTLSNQVFNHLNNLKHLRKYDVLSYETFKFSINV